ncbi:MAG: hypothetical protein ACI9T8_000595, partial [Candidatus Saccharimonadales bacterium]
SDKVCVSGKDPVLFGAGDSVFIDKSEEFYWEGKFSSYMVCTPAFDPAQHVEVE